MSENVIQIANLTKRYKTKTVLNILELRLVQAVLYLFSHLVFRRCELK